MEASNFLDVAEFRCVFSSDWVTSGICEVGETV